MTRCVAWLRSGFADMRTDRRACRESCFCVQEVCLHAALAAGHDQAVLQAALRRLQQPEVVRLMGYLLRWVDRHPGEANAPPYSREAIRNSGAQAMAHGCVCAVQQKTWSGLGMSDNITLQNAIPGLMTATGILTLAEAVRLTALNYR